MFRAVIPSAGLFGCSGPELTDEEWQFFEEIRPFGFILFARNVDTPDQVRSLCNDLRQAGGRPDAPILIDQEGGRVQRLKPPHWRAAPPMRVFGQLYETDPELAISLCLLNARLLAAELADLGIDTDCLPLLDLPQAGAHDVIGDRAFAPSPDPVIALGRAVIDGLEAGGIFPIIKHIPGHGRAMADSHKALPRVDTDRRTLEEWDFAPFTALAEEASFAMTAHILYTALDAQAPATLSEMVIDEIIRGYMGFDGLLMSDDLSMQALEGPFDARAAGCLTAGCDLVLHCNGNLAEMRAVAEGLQPLSPAAQRRWDTAQARRIRNLMTVEDGFDRLEAENRLNRWLASPLSDR